MADTLTPLEEDNVYHIYNHAVGNDVLFKTEGNYMHFLTRIEKYLIDNIDIYAYCLLPNHFHLLVRINPTRVYNPRRVPISRLFAHAFNSYAQAFNKENLRKGSLFNNRFKRKHVRNEFEKI